jgi:hypothetical protein
VTRGEKCKKQNNRSHSIAIDVIPSMVHDNVRHSVSAVQNVVDLDISAESAECQSEKIDNPRSMQLRRKTNPTAKRNINWSKKNRNEKDLKVYKSKILRIHTDFFYILTIFFTLLKTKSKF